MDDEDEGEAPAAGRPAPFPEVLPQAGLGRHGGVGYELVLANAVPQLGVELNLEQHMVAQVVSLWLKGALVGTMLREAQSDEKDQQKDQGKAGSGSSSKREQDGGKEEEDEEEEEKLPKTHSSSFLLMGGVRDQDAGEDARVRSACGRIRVHPRMHAEFLKAVHNKEDAGYSGRMDNYIEEKVIMVDTGEEIILNNGTPGDEHVQ